jgi:hypothetical protein
MKKVSALVLVLVCVFCLFSNVQAEVYTSLLPTLVNLSGWKADKAEGMDLVMPGMNMITASRIYNKGNKEVTAMVMIGSEMMIAGQAGIEMNSSTLKMNTQKINGFEVTTQLDKVNNTGSIIVYLDKTTDSGAYFIVSFTGCDDKEALELAKKFDWKKMKQLTKAAK